MLLPHAVGVFITLIQLCSVYYVVYSDIPLREAYLQLLYIISHISHYGAGLSLNMAGVFITLIRLCSVYYVVYSDIPLRWAYHQLLYIISHISHYGAGLSLNMT